MKCNSRLVKLERLTQPADNLPLMITQSLVDRLNRGDDDANIRRIAELFDIARARRDALQ